VPASDWSIKLFAAAAKPIIAQKNMAAVCLVVVYISEDNGTPFRAVIAATSDLIDI